ncbi:Na/Pi cotransporter family protein [Alcanivorax jadensis]|jgi:phosphate:Na+ symporter|uniref:Na/Pi cotransporter family protein n=1 Tax=Alcanivorax jadensis TaxID=64988 RepID=UPI00235686EC|nr:Na/Pi symporter [Alcanivorax jadensis]MDF1638210.1 Na/Pi symporter [Alcanivorax jadensis]|tara:strand:- start:5855 stop:7522 length:1668 start_codon:yes stop_codon:yes gene_type:complete
MEYVTTVLGGVGLFLLGMWLITEGLKVAAGASLEKLLASWTRNRLRGLLSGTLLTALVQSSSAITVAALGFVNTGLLRFERAVWVIFGSNLGTTLTAWVVALVGVKFQINAIALPLVGIGALMRVFAPADRYRNLGMALAGFGVLFLGIEVLSSGFQHMGESFPLPDAGTPLVWLILVGIILTTLMQSSSAAVALVLTALAGGLLGFREAAAVVIGANVGTTSTALLATLGATANARRLAVAHVLFNILTGVMALLLLSPLLDLVGYLAGLWQLDGDPAAQLALFHTCFNLMGIALMWPLEPTLSRFLLRRFGERQKSTVQLQFLDRNLVTLPDAARVALSQEMQRLLAQYPQALATLPAPDSDRLEQIADRTRLHAGVGDFLADVARQQLVDEQVAAFQMGWRLQGNLVNMDETLQRLNGFGLAMQRHSDWPVIQALLSHWFANASRVMEQDWQRGGERGADASLLGQYESTKSALLANAMAGKLSRQSLDLALQSLSQGRWFLEQWQRALEYHHQLSARDPVDGSLVPAAEMVSIGEQGKATVSRERDTENAY